MFREAIKMKKEANEKIIMKKKEDLKIKNYEQEIIKQEN